jgi:hypothetical protein
MQANAQEFASNIAKMQGAAAAANSGGHKKRFGFF